MKLFKRIGFIIFLFQACWNMLHAQDPGFHIKNIALDEGVQPGSQTDVVQDGNGFIWISTLNGLYRFDGYALKRYYHDNTNPRSLPTNAVKYLLINDKGELLVCGQNSLASYNKSQDGFETIELPSENLFYWKPFCDETGKIWFEQYDEESGGGILYYYDRYQRTTTFSSLNYNQELGISEELNYVFNFGNGRMIIQSGDEMFSVSLSDQPLTRNNISIPEGHTMGEISCATISSDHTLWLLSNNNQIFYLLPGDSILIFLNLSQYMSQQTPIQHISCDNKDKLWISQDRILIYDLGDNKFNFIEYESCQDQSEGTRFLGSICHLTDGSHVVNSINNFVLTEYKSEFKYQILDQNEGQKYRNNAVFAIAEDRHKNVWVGSLFNGLYKIYREKNEDYSISESPDHIALANGIKVSALYLDSANVLWVGTPDKGIYYYSIEDHQLTQSSLQVMNENEGINQNPIVRKIVNDRNGNIWIVRNNGLTSYDPIADTLSYFNITTLDPKYPDFHMFDVIEDEKGQIWYTGGLGHLHYISEDRSEVRSYEIPNCYSAFCLYEDRLKKELWIGTSDLGIVNFSIRDLSFGEIIDVNNGLSGMTVYGIVEDSKRNLWISTNNGISCMNLNNRSISTYGKYDGLPFADFNTGAYYQDSSGRIYFGGDGLIYFHPDSVIKSKTNYQSPLVITSFQVFGKERPIQYTNEGFPTVELQSNENYFEIQYASLDYRYPSRQNYQSRLVGLSEEWGDDKDSHIRQFTNLKYGSYTFEIKATNSQGQWNDEIFQLGINIIPFWWERTISKLIAIFLTLAMIIYLIIYLMGRRNISKLSHMNRELMESRILALKGQMKKHFVFNVLNSANNMISKNDFLQSNEILVKMSDYLRGELDNANKHFIPLIDEISSLELYLELQTTRFPDKFEYRIDVDKMLDPTSCLIPSVLIQPLVENAIEHGFRDIGTLGKLFISFAIEKEHLICIVDDNGIGYNKSLLVNDRKNQSHHGIGLLNIENRLKGISEIYKSDIVYRVIDKASEKEGESGTCIRIEIPTKILMN